MIGSNASGSIKIVIPDDAVRAFAIALGISCARVMDEAVALAERMKIQRQLQAIRWDAPKLRIDNLICSEKVVKLLRDIMRKRFTKLEALHDSGMNRAQRRAKRFGSNDVAELARKSRRA